MTAPVAEATAFICNTCLAETATPGPHCTGTAIADHAAARVTAARRRAAAAEATTPTPTLNLPLAEAVLEQITTHPETHDQGNFGVRRPDCGTTYCIAGWAIALSPDVDHGWRPGPSGTFDEMAMVEFLDRRRLPGWRSAPFEAGRELLGLSERAADWLFLECDETEAVDYLRELIAAARQVTA
jgi:hypothetical protein